MRTRKRIGSISNSRRMSRVAKGCLAGIALATMLLLVGCWSGFTPILEDYNSRFAMDVDVPSPSRWKEVVVKGVGYANARWGTNAPSPSDLEAKGYGPGSLPDDMRWYIKTPAGITPEQTVDVTCYYNPDLGYLQLPPAAALGLMLVTWELSGSPTAGMDYRLIGEGTLEDGSGLRILSEIGTAPEL